MTGITISLRVTAPGPAVARVSVGRRQFSIGRPVEFDDASPHVAALEYALGAVGGEVVNCVREFARRRRLAIDAVEALVTGELQDGLAYLEVIGEKGRPRIRRIAIRVFVASKVAAMTAAARDLRMFRLKGLLPSPLSLLPSPLTPRTFLSARYPRPYRARRLIAASGEIRAARRAGT